MAESNSHPPRTSGSATSGSASGTKLEVPISDHGLAYGLGFFETFRTSGGRIHAWERHERRLAGACRRAGMVVPETFFARSESRRNNEIREQLAVQGLSDAVFRYTITAGPPGPEGGYHAPVEILTSRALPPPAAEEGIALRLLEFERDNGEWIPRPKSLNYANALLGANELARRAGRADDEGLFVNRDGGWIVETARQNVAWLQDGQWFHPDPSLGAVAGTCLEWMVEHSGGLPRRIRPEELARAQAVIVLNAVRGVTPVARLWDVTDGRVIGEWRSYSMPQVIALRDAWVEALRATARG